MYRLPFLLRLVRCVGFLFLPFPGTLIKSVISAVSSVTSVFRSISLLVFSAFNSKSSVKVGRISVVSSSQLCPLSYVFLSVFSSVCCCVYMLYNVGAYVSVGILFCYVFVLSCVVALFTFHLSFFPFLF